jgi:hypothetical protein
MIKRSKIYGLALASMLNKPILREMSRLSQQNKVKHEKNLETNPDSFWRDFNIQTYRDFVQISIFKKYLISHNLDHL